jgi:hypothetical protein
LDKTHKTESNQEISHDIDISTQTFQVLSPGRRTNSGSSLETSSSSTEFPLLRRSYMIMTYMSNLQKEFMLEKCKNE